MEAKVSLHMVYGGEQVISIMQNDASWRDSHCAMVGTSVKSMIETFGVFCSNIQNWIKDWVKMSIRSLVCSWADKYELYKA